MTSNNAGGSKRAFVLIALGLILVGFSLYTYLKDDGVATFAAHPDAPVVAGEDGDAPEAPVAKEDAIDVKAALAVRTLGDTSAPAKIVEFASLTCGHCAKFHKEGLADLRKGLIADGKAYIVFSEFPLNRPALDGAMVARCLPADQYVPFTDVLFAEQDKWAFDVSYTSKLRAYAEEFGMSKDTFDDCLASEGLRDGIIARMQAAQKQWEISSTPSFVVNNQVTLTGTQPAVAFEKAIEALNSAAE